jgi:ABC-type polysaccharide/polyol phosphate transport system ATPase subunit
MAAAIDVRGLGVRFRRRGHRHGLLGLRGPTFWALRELDLAVAPGEALGVIGHNGSGKTTLLQTVAGVLRPTEGEVMTAGRVSSLVELQAGASRDLSGHENLLIQGVLLGMSRAELRGRYDDIAAFAGLTEDELASPVRTYSAGMGLRLGFSIVVHTDPDVLLVDEVLAVGDEAFQTQCFAKLDERRGAGCAVMIVSHDLGLVRRHCDRTIVLHHGRMAFEGGTPDAIERYHEIARAP